MGFLTLYLILTAIIIYGKTTCTNHGSFIVVGMQHNPNRERPIQKLNNQLRLLEIAGWGRGGSNDRGDDITED